MTENPLLSEPQENPPLSSSPAAWMATFRGGGLRWLRRGLTLLIVLGFAVRLTVRDRWLPPALVYYALPPAVLAGLLIVRALLARTEGNRRRAQCWAAGAAAALVWCLIVCREWNPPRPPSPGDTFRIAVWNVAHGRVGMIRDLAVTIRGFDADIVALIEAGTSSERRRRSWREAFPDYEVSVLGGEIICLSRGSAGPGQPMDLAYDGRLRRIDVTIDQQAVSCLLIDVDSDPLHPRGPTLQEIATAAEALAERPVVVLGDFNTPSDSVHFAGLRRGHRNAFESSGRGYAPTWPLPVPVLTLDQIWLNVRLEAVHCTAGWAAGTDHRPVVADVRFVAARETGRGVPDAGSSATLLPSAGTVMGKGESVNPAPTDGR